MSEPALSQRLAEATHALHRRAEQSGVMRALLHGTLAREAYCRLLRNLQALYAALEGALDGNARSPYVAPIRMPALYRTAALRADLATLHGDDWPALPLAPAMQRYVSQIDTRSRLAPHLLSAHAYVRYMGDMSGGQILRGIVARSLGLQADAGTAFYAFTAVSDLPALKTRFRAALDALPLDSAKAGDVTAEAVDGFGLHVELFEELDR